MRLTILLCSILLSSCATHGPNPDDPYESFNRRIFDFNRAVDATMLKPPARLYKTVVPGPVRVSITNAFENINMIPTVANDALQANFPQTTKDTWRFMINSTFGVLGLFDVAQQWGLPKHSNDFGVTFAKWGVKKSPYIVIPILGPSTLRDGTGTLIEFATLSPYAYIDDVLIAYSVGGLRTVDIRSQLFDSEKLMCEAIDPYAFVRDAYLQRREFLINGGNTTAVSMDGVQTTQDSSAPTDYVDE